MYKIIVEVWKVAVSIFPITKILRISVILRPSSEHSQLISPIYEERVYSYKFALTVLMSSRRR